MKTIFKITIYIYTAILPLLMVQGSHKETKNLLDRMAVKNAKVAKVFRPSINGFLGEGATGLVYEGVLNGMRVAMKFVSSDFHRAATNEINAYVALGALNNTNLEAYGIPTLFHHGTWNNSYILATTLLDSKFEQTRKAGRLTAIDKLIVFREMVRISKYIHSRGYCHGDLHMANIMFRSNRAFVIDYDRAVNVGNDYKAANTCAKKDWKKFLADIASTCGVKIDYNSPTNPTKKFKKVKSNELKRVFIECAYTIYEDERLKYDHMYKVINEEIKKANGHTTAIVSWISREDARRAEFSGMSLDQEPSTESIKSQTDISNRERS